jgi:BlaI family transcriptional regulator, penicillinase repressor
MLNFQHIAEFLTSMDKTPSSGSRKLSRRERQIMDIIYARGRATASDVQEALPDPPSYSATRATLRILEEKGHLRHEEENLRYVFIPVVARQRASVPALRHLMDTFFEGSPERVVSALLDPASTSLTTEELDRMAQLIASARKERKIP